MDVKKNKIICNYPGVVSIRYFILFTFKRQRELYINEKEKPKILILTPIDYHYVFYFYFIITHCEASDFFKSFDEENLFDCKKLFIYSFCSSCVSPHWQLATGNANPIDEHEHTSNTIRFYSSFPFARLLTKAYE